MSERATLFDAPVTKSAVISECGAYRYSLTRIWDRPRGLMVFAMLNPSTADAEMDDPTIRRCVGFAKREGLGGIAVINLYAGRATKPADLWKMAFPHGGDNHHHWGLWLQDASNTVVCAWGANAKDWDEGEFYRFAGGLGVDLYCLGKTKDGKPKHPLYLPGDAPLTILRHGRSKATGSAA